MKTLRVSGWKLALFYLAHLQKYDELRQRIEDQIKDKPDDIFVTIDEDINDALEESIEVVWMGYMRRENRSKEKSLVMERRMNEIRER